jgi:16S rRNA (guanine527-N7)-methyltransferase
MPPAVNLALLEGGLSSMGLRPGPEALGKLARYVAEIELWNQAYGLVNDSGDGLITRHILDSLSGLPLIASRNPTSLADAGSGAGLPGIPLAICLPDVRVSLIERSGKRCRFLENQKALLRLANVDIREKDIEKASGQFDIVTFRAFRPLEKPILDALLALLAPGGSLAAYKGKRSKIDEELGGIAGYGLDQKVEPLLVPGLEGEERHLVFLSRKP